LASKLIGWDIDIKSEEEKRREIEAEMTALTAPTTPLTALAGVGPKTIEKIEAAGITSLEQLAGMTPEQLMEIPGIGEKMVDKIYQAVNQYYEGGGAASAEAGEVSGEQDAEAAIEQTPEANEAVSEAVSGQAPENPSESAAGTQNPADEGEVETALPPQAAGEPDPGPEAESKSDSHLEKNPETNS
jgi:transcription termination/antitermination protein NusA